MSLNAVRAESERSPGGYHVRHRRVRTLQISAEASCPLWTPWLFAVYLGLTKSRDNSDTPVPVRGGKTFPEGASHSAGNASARTADVSVPALSYPVGAEQSGGPD